MFRKIQHSLDAVFSQSVCVCVCVRVYVYMELAFKEYLKIKMYDSKEVICLFVTKQFGVYLLEFFISWLFHINLLFRASR